MLLLLCGVARAEIPPPPQRWVTDTAGLLSPEARVRIDGELEAYERQTGHQVVVWIGSATEGDLADWATRTFDAWDLGRKGEDDGLALFVDPDDRRVAIEVGYGLEGQVPDLTASRIIAEQMAPRLQAGDPDGAIEAGVDAIVTAIEGGPVELAPPPSEPQPVALTPGQMVLFGIAAVVFLFVLVTNPRLALWLLWSMAARGSGGGGGGGFEGGGGRSGGGGARGSW